MKTTLNKIREFSPCKKSWGKLLEGLNKTKADDEPLSIRTVLELNGFADALWCLRAVEGFEREIRLYAVWCAEQVAHLMTDQRSKNALILAKNFAKNAASKIELNVAAANASEAAVAAYVNADRAANAARAAAADRARLEQERELIRLLDCIENNRRYDI